MSDLIKRLGAIIEAKLDEFSSGDYTLNYERQPGTTAAEDIAAIVLNAMWVEVASFEPVLGQMYLCWSPDWVEPTMALMWKENGRITQANPDDRRGMVPLYYGDPDEMDDYDFALPSNFPKYVMEYPVPPSIAT